MLIVIKHRRTGASLYEGDHDDIRSALVEAVRKRVDLSGACLRGEMLDGADLRGALLSGAMLDYASLNGANLLGALLDEADLRGSLLKDADLRGALLDEADLRGALLKDAELRGAMLADADLRGAHISWSSHELISEILWRAAGDIESRQMLATYIGRRTDWCWYEWAMWRHPARDWAIRELAKWARDDDDGVPDIVRKHINTNETGGT